MNARAFLLLSALVGILYLSVLTSGQASGGSEQMAQTVPPAQDTPSPTPAMSPTPTPTPTPKPTPAPVKPQ